jgi:DNA-binding MarR family transcriptional regulator
VTAGPPDPGSPPLARLFAVAFRSLIDGLHVELRARGWHDVRPAFGFVLLAAADAPTAVTDLASLLGTTKQAASKLVDAMVQAGYVRREPGPDDRRRRPVALTARGRALLLAVDDIYRDLERGWAEVIGPAAVERLRSDLVTVMADGPDGRLPPVRPTW